ncbi:hypothetical protein V2G26_006832 [Clonostachys chloroleuca]
MKLWQTATSPDVIADSKLHWDRIVRYQRAANATGLCNYSPGLDHAPYRILRPDWIHRSAKIHVKLISDFTRGGRGDLMQAPSASTLLFERPKVAFPGASIQLSSNPGLYLIFCRAWATCYCIAASFRLGSWSGV